MVEPTRQKFNSNPAYTGPKANGQPTSEQDKGKVKQEVSKTQQGLERFRDPKDASNSSKSKTSNQKSQKPFTDKEGNELGSFGFDVASIFKDANTPEKTREKRLAALRFLENKCKDHPELKKICQDLHKAIDTNNDSPDILRKLKDSLRKIKTEVGPIIEDGSEKSKENGIDYNSVAEKYDLTTTLMKLIPAGPFTDKEGNELGSILFDVANIFKDANTPEKMRAKLLVALKFLENKCKDQDHPELKAICRDFHRVIHNKDDSVDILTQFEDALNTISKEAELVRSKDEDEGKESAYVTEKRHLVYALKDLMNPYFRMRREASSKEILPLSESGENKWREGDSFFATTTQESGTGDNSESIASEIRKGKGDSIENAFLNFEKNSSEKDTLSPIPIHRLSESSTKDENNEFEVFFVTGAPREGEKPDKFSKSEETLTGAIQETYGDKCKNISSLKKLTVEEFENHVIELAKRLKEKGIKKLYMFYNGHGGKDGIPEGVAVGDGKKQGAEKFVFVLDGPDNELTEEKMKEIYNNHLEGIEVISVFDTCNSGAAVTAIEKKDPGNKLDVVA